ncbi:MAG: peptidylprolyl isomerase, partial [Chitinophagaceae bacterium]|nr:peptidylprolyl isomerase [Chitinophagaceae bacterium]
MTRNLVSAIVFILFSITVFAQHKVVADKVIGIVGDKIILQSDITNAVSDLQRQEQGRSLPPDIDCYMLGQQLILKAMVVQAERDSVIIEDEEVEALLDNQIRGFINQYGSKEALEQIAGRTIYQIKDDFRQSFKEKELARKMRDKIV